MGKHGGKLRNFNWMKYIFIIVVFSLLLSGLAIYLMPVVAYYHVELAIAEKNPGKLASHMDVAEVRKNLKLQKGERIIRDVKKEGDKGPFQPSLVDLSIQWTALQSDAAIDEAISTEGFYVSLWGRKADIRKPDPIRPLPEQSSYELIKRLLAYSSFHYSSGSRFVVQVKDDKNRYVGYLTFVFTREGLHWRLSNVILPLF
jgi:hypothetical protein